MGTRLQTIERPKATPRGPGRPQGRGATARSRWSTVVGVAAAALTVPALVAAVFTKWGVLVAVALAVVVALAAWVRQAGFSFIQIIAFLIHFDGLGAGPIRTGRVMAGIAALLILYKLLVEKWRPPAIPARHWVPVWALLVWATFSGVWSASSSGWLFGMGVLGLGVVYFAVTGMLVDSHDKIREFLRAYWVGGLFGSAAGILALFLGTRSVGFGSDPNYFGLLQASMIPLTVHYRREATTRAAKHAYTFALLFAFAGLAGGGSRSGLIGASLAIVGTMVTRPGLQLVQRAGVGLGSIFVAGITFLVGFVANPHNLQRGFSDRGSGRLDLWTTSIELVKEQPLVGYGLGQLRFIIPPYLLVTPGSQRLGESRGEVSAHNTWLDIAGDLGLIGVGIFATVFVVAMVGFFRPRWLQARELSTTLFVMMLPVLSGSLFLPLLNNKLGWALLGLSAALQTPSWGARWSGLPGTVDPSTVPVSVAASRAGTARAGPVDVRPDGPPEEAAAPADGAPGAWESVRLALWDLRVSRRSRAMILAGALIGAILMSTAASTLPTKYRASAGLFTPRLDAPENAEHVSVHRTRLQGILTMAVSGAYAAELKRLSGVELSVPEVRKRLMATRPGKKMGAYIEIEYSDTDRDNTLAVMPHLVTALDNVYRSTVELSEEVVANEVRQVVPGEQRYYTGPHYLRAPPDPVFAETPPPSGWMTFVGMCTGALAATGVALSRQRRPRVNGDDDFPRVTGASVWAHVGRHGRRYGASPGQYARVVAAARDHLPPDREPRRLVVASARPDRAVPGLAMGVAAALVAEGRRVVLVDAQMERPSLTARLGGLTAAGLAEVAAGERSLGEVLRRPPRWRFAPAPRRTMRRGEGELRFVPAGRRHRGRQVAVPLDALDLLDDDVYVVLLAPPSSGEVPLAPVLGWGDAVVLALVEGRTVTFDAEDAASRVRNFASAPYGIVLLDV